ncbi:MAG: sn-glycerol-3-phosphate ABC transporter ATP-binding protein UgpC [Candidatus Omnitrophica bacterium]|nr:sn-glycerol-3-phosphate ABC transporter ATP-binding protein UgpC [Candidatus Omnitrophota bacterium]
MSQVSLCNVTKTYPNGTRAVSNLNLGVESREFMALVGPSGCGKTTALRMIAGLESVTEGKIYIGKYLVNNTPARDRDIAMVFQNYALYPYMNVYENMAFGLKLRGYPTTEIEKRVKEAALILEIEDILSRRPYELSGGERQRVAVGRAIVRKPLVFLFDEPLSNLDANLRAQMRTELHRLHLKLRTTMIYVTHDQVEAMTLGDRIAVMKEGTIFQTEAPMSVYKNPANKFVAGFIGSPPMNFIDGGIVKKDDKLYFDEGSFQVKIAENTKKPLLDWVDKKLIFGIRPEDIYDRLFISEAPPENIFKAFLEVAEPMGSESHLHFKTARQNRFIAKIPSIQKPGAGQDMELVFDMSKAHFFNKDTENTIV